MTERSGRVMNSLNVSQIALEAMAGFLAAYALLDLARRFGVHAAPEAWAGATVGFARLLVLALRRSWAAPMRLPSVSLLVIAVVAVASAWSRSGVDAAVVLMPFAAFMLFRLAAEAVNAVLGALSNLDGGPSLPMPRSSTVGGYAGGLDLCAAAGDLAPSRIAMASVPPAAQRATMVAMSEHAVVDAEGHGVRAVRSDVPAHDWLDIDRLPADWLEDSGALQEMPLAAAARRAFDILAAGGLLLFTLPLMLVAALAIRLETSGPVFYRQERVGRNGRVFTLFKFRSMTADAEAHGGPVWAVPQDPRVTRVGRFIRLTRIDEIPQVLNVLRGDMAFIGPRPERPLFVAQLERAIPRYADRAVVKPGITGWAQVRYRYGASVEDARMKLGYDLYYIRHRSLALDLRILAATVRVVVLQEGAR